MKKLAASLAAAAILALLYFSGAFESAVLWLEERGEDKPLAVYVSPEGVRFESHSAQWGEQNLKRLSEAFSQNARSSELKKLGRVKLVPDEGIKTGEINLKWISDFKGNPIFMVPGRTITLYYADKYTTAKSMSLTLSHEYGHLFTFYWLFEKEGKMPADPDTGWAKLRGLESYPIRWKNSPLPYDHYWSAEEIMADEYAELFGAKEGKGFSEPSGGGIAHADKIENLSVPAAEAAPGLREYWEKLSGVRTGLKRLAAPGLTKIEPRKGSHAFWIEAAASEKGRSVEHFLRWSDRASVSGNFHLMDTAPKIGSSEPFIVSGIPKGISFVQLFAYDKETRQLSYSPPVWFDFSNPAKPVQLNGVGAQ